MMCLLATGTGCGLTSPSGSPLTPVGTVVPLTHPEGWYAANEWMPDGTLVIAFGGVGQSGEPQLFTGSIEANELALTPLDLPPATDCRRPRYGLPTAIGELLGLQRECLDTPVPTYQWFTLDRAVNSMEPFVDLGQQVLTVAWDATNELGWYSAGSRICQGVGAMDRSGPVETDLVAIADGQRVELDDTLASLGKGDCPGAPRADRPAWSAAANMLALLASPGGPNVGGPQRLDLPWTVNVYQAGSGEPRAVVEGIVDARAPAWSPDGKLLVISGVIEGRGGTWLYDVEGDSLLLLADELVAGLRFSPDGNSIFGIVSAGTLSRLVLIHLPPVTN